MKKVFSVLAAAIIAIAFTSCGGGADTPEKVAEKFLNHMAKQEFADAKKLATGDALEMIKTIESFATLGDDSEADAEAPKIENMKCETTEEASTCTYTQDGVDQSIELQKVEGKWLVSQFPKEGSSNTDEDVDVDVDVDEDMDADTEEGDDVTEEWE
jgi:hypothetical protein